MIKIPYVNDKNIEIIKKFFLILLFATPLLIMQFTAQSTIVINLINFIHTHIILYILILILTKAISIVYPPIPGIVFTISSIPLIGWQLAYFVDISGSVLGATIAFFLGKKYGYTILQQVVGKLIATKVSSIKLKQKNQIEASIFLKLAAGGVLSDGLAWGASLIGFRYLPFIIGYIISHIINTLFIFYLIAKSISFNSWVIISIAAVFAWIIIFKYKGRYFE